MHILLVDDDEDFCDLAGYHLKMNPDNNVVLTSNGKQFLKSLNSSIDVAFIDFNLPDISGDKLLTEVKQSFPNIEVVMISAQSDINLAIDLLRKGAYDYVTKDENAFKKVWSILTRIGEKNELKGEVKQLRKRLEKVEIVNSPMVGESKELQLVNTLIGKAAGSQINVFVTGETGTGKELVAQTIHKNSDRKKNAFIAINVAAIPNELLESELFGHKKGAFTGANQDRVGKFEEADGGTIFLDEIAEMDISLQAKILRVLQESEVTRIGDNKSKKINFRLITASHQDLKKMVGKGLFREDLYYRMIGLNIDLPPLRNRGSDVLLLANYFLKSFAESNGTEEKALSREAQKKIMMHSFPGNIRELKSIMDLSMIMSDSDEILPQDIRIESISIDSFDKKMVGETKTMKEYELYILQHYLEKHDFDIKAVADILDIGKSSIYRMISQNKLKK